MDKAILYIHGKGGSAAEAEQYKPSCAGFELIGVDYSGNLPWTVEKQIRPAYDEARERYGGVSLLANSIGAYLAMHALRDCEIEKALFISPVLDMERLILDMMSWAKVTEDELRARGEIPAALGETLSWEYLSYVRQHPISWKTRTEILYGEKDELISRATVDAFVKTHDASLTVMKNGEHWFHTPEQLAFLHAWLKETV